jgi:hypothetical protein
MILHIEYEQVWLGEHAWEPTFSRTTFLAKCLPLQLRSCPTGRRTTRIASRKTALLDYSLTNDYSNTLFLCFYNVCTLLQPYL